MPHNALDINGIIVVLIDGVETLRWLGLLSGTLASGSQDRPHQVLRQPRYPSEQSSFVLHRIHRFLSFCSTIIIGHC
jgi:hypothetical protein